VGDIVGDAVGDTHPAQVTMQLAATRVLVSHCPCA
jgi:hypothetical protein